MRAMSATALSNTSWLCDAGWRNPLIFRTNWSAAASTSSEGAGSAPSLSNLMERHISQRYRTLGCTVQVHGGRHQSIGSRPAASSAALAREKGRLPKKPRCADKGDG